MPARSSTCSGPVQAARDRVLCLRTWNCPLTWCAGRAQPFSPSVKRYPSRSASKRAREARPLLRRARNWSAGRSGTRGRGSAERHRSRSRVASRSPGQTSADSQHAMAFAERADRVPRRRRGDARVEAMCTIATSMPAVSTAAARRTGRRESSTSTPASCARALRARGLRIIRDDDHCVATEPGLADEHARQRRIVEIRSAARARPCARPPS